MRLVRGLGAVMVVFMVLLAACRASPTSGRSPAPVAVPAGGGANEEPPPAGCDDFDGVPLQETMSAQAVVLEEGSADVPRVEAVVYPHPDYRGKPWSQWGQGVSLADGVYLSAIGDHLGEDGNSYVYRYDRQLSELSLVADVLSILGHRQGDWGYGKVHGQMVMGTCGDVYFSTYWGKKPDLDSVPDYQGDVLFRIDPQAQVIASLGVPVEQHGIPSLAGWTEGGLIYGEAVHPDAKPKDGPFFAYDPRAEEMVFRSDPAGPHEGFRNVAVDGDGRAYFSAGGGKLLVFDPATKELGGELDGLPGGWLRASTAPAPDGTVYAATREPDALFALAPSGDIRELGPARGYVASMALHPEGDRFFYVPEAHGKSWKQGTPLISVDTQTGAEQVIIELNRLAEETLGLRLGGTYNVAVSPDGGTVYLGMNAGPLPDETFGEVVLVIVQLP